MKVITNYHIAETVFNTLIPLSRELLRMINVVAHQTLFSDFSQYCLHGCVLQCWVYKVVQVLSKSF